ncbi:hypothetical protein [Nocardiopsis coralliicola]
MTALDTAGPAARTLFAALFDDAAVFPPGRAPLEQALPAHRAHTAGPRAALVGPLVLPVAALEPLAELLSPAEPPLDLVLTAPGGPDTLPAALEEADRLGADLRAVEIAVPDGMSAAELPTALDRALATAPGSTGVYVEVPRDDRRTGILAALAETGRRAKFRTGGIRADLYPDEAELAGGIAAAAAAGIPFKATAGLHHAVRNTAPDTGFEQHGFLNLLLAAEAAADGAEPGDLAALLAERDAAALARRAGALSAERAAAARAAFASYGTCSITEPLGELVDLGLLPAAVLDDGD